MIAFMRILGIRRPVLIAFLVVLGLVPLYLWFFQARMIYLPSGYALGEVPAADLPRLWPLRFTTDAGEQLAFYVPPREGDRPSTVWLFCAGNADRALSWRNFATDLPDPRAGALLVDYPGYGDCAGIPTPASILASTRGAVAALAKRLGDADLKQRIAVYGHSLGAAAAMQYAQAEGAERAVLIAPFTTMMAMARRRVGWPLCELLRHRFDNETAARVLRAAGTPVLVVHGGRDGVIPLAMGERVADLAGGTLIAVPEAGHIDIADEAEEQVRAFMLGTWPAGRGSGTPEIRQTREAALLTVPTRPTQVPALHR